MVPQLEQCHENGSHASTDFIRCNSFVINTADQVTAAKQATSCWGV